jgi:hypothetical protein
LNGSRRVLQWIEYVEYQIVLAMEHLSANIGEFLAILAVKLFTAEKYKVCAKFRKGNIGSQLIDLLYGIRAPGAKQKSCSTEQLFRQVNKHYRSDG